MRFNTANHQIQTWNFIISPGKRSKVLLSTNKYIDKYNDSDGCHRAI